MTKSSNDPLQQQRDDETRTEARLALGKLLTGDRGAAQNLSKAFGVAAAGDKLECVRRLVRQEGSAVLLDNAARSTSSTRNSGQPVTREPVIGGAVFLFGTVWLVATLVMAISSETPWSMGQTAGGMAFGMLFACIGYCLLAYRDTFAVDRATRKWRHVKGLFPILMRQSGSLSEAKGLRVCRQTRTAYGGLTKWDYKVRAVQVIWCDTSRQPLTLNALDLSTDYVEQGEALQLYNWYGTLIGLSIVEGGAEEIAERGIHNAE